MTSLLLDEDGDLDLQDNDLVLVSGVEEFRQRLTSRLRFFKGEWIFDRDMGVPWLQDIFRKGVTRELLLATVRDVLRNCPGVRDVLDINIEIHNREAKVRFRVQYDTGTEDEQTISI